MTVHCAGPVLYEDRPLAEEGMRHAVVVPMTHEGKRIGTFNTDLRTIRERTPEEMECLVTVAGQIAVAVATADTFFGRALRAPQPVREPSGFLIPDASAVAKQLVANCPSLHAQIGTLRSMAETDATVLVTGETGTGKGVVARALHAWSWPAAGSLRQVRLRGARHAASSRASCSDTSAARSRAPIGGAPGCSRRRTAAPSSSTRSASSRWTCRPSSSRVLQDRRVPAASAAPPRSSSTFACWRRPTATCEPTWRTGASATDLFFRLNVLQLHMPPLRERSEDVVPLAEHFVRTRSHGLERLHDVLRPGVLESLVRYSWPGNVRELETVIERAMVLGEEFMFESDQDCRVRAPTPELVTASGLEDDLVSLAEAESRHIAKVLRATGGRIAGPHGAARILGLHPNTLRSLMIRLNYHQRSAL